MQFSSRLTIATHILLCIVQYSDIRRVTSKFLASSLQVNPVIIRQVTGQLKEAGIVTVEAGLGGAKLARPMEDITLLDVFRAVEDTSAPLFRFHDNPNPRCPVGCVVHSVMDDHLQQAQDSMLAGLNAVKLSSLASDMRRQINALEKGADDCGLCADQNTGA